MTLFEQITSVEQLRAGFERVEENEGSCGVDGVTIAEFGFDLENSLVDLSLELRQRTYRPQPLLRVSIPRLNGKVRNLSIPSVRDRTAQSSASLVLAPILEGEFEDCSFAYRKERSVQKAIRRISELREKGYVWVVDADISAFFDEVDHDLLLEALGCHVSDPDVLGLVERWLKCEIVLNGRCERLAKGIPQGSPISPLLSNLYLDDFDEALLRAKQKLVRFADDFVILCKDRDDAKDALELTEDTLEKLRLCLNPSKTRITTFDHGFRYLGVQFLKSMVFKPSEEEGEKCGPSLPEMTLGSSAPPVENEEAPPVLDSASPPTEHAGVLADVLPPSGEGEGGDGTGDGDDGDESEPSEGKDPFLRTLYLMDQGTVLGKEGEHFRVMKKGETIKEIPVFKVNQIFVFGHIQITTQAMEFCLLKDIPVVLLSAAGRYFGTIESFRTMRTTVHKNQFDTRADEEKTLAVSRAIISAKVINEKVVIQRYSRKRPHVDLGQHIGRLNSLLREIPSAADTSRLMGLEGAASVSYFAAMRTLIGSGWGFEKRQKQPPRDPVNSMLSYGYTLLFYNIYAMVRSHGLHPFVGFLHEIRDGHPALISDILEEFRAPVIDTMVMNLLLRNMVGRDDFTMLDGEKGSMCVMSGGARKTFIRAFEGKMNSTVHHPPTGFTVDYRRCIDLQVQALKRIIEGSETEYRPFEIK